MASQKVAELDRNPDHRWVVRQAANIPALPSAQFELEVQADRLEMLPGTARFCTRQHPVAEIPGVVGRPEQLDRAAAPALHDQG
jgi:hypothetical protein